MPFYGAGFCQRKERLPLVLPEHVHFSATFFFHEQEQAVQIDRYDGSGLNRPYFHDPQTSGCWNPTPTRRQHVYPGTSLLHLHCWPEDKWTSSLISLRPGDSCSSQYRFMTTSSATSTTCLTAGCFGDTSLKSHPSSKHILFKGCFVLQQYPVAFFLRQQVYHQRKKGGCERLK